MNVITIVFALSPQWTTPTLYNIVNGVKICVQSDNGTNVNTDQFCLLAGSELNEFCLVV